MQAKYAAAGAVLRMPVTQPGVCGLVYGISPNLGLRLPLNRRELPFVSSTIKIQRVLSRRTRPREKSVHPGTEESKSVAGLQYNTIR